MSWEKDYWNPQLEKEREKLANLERDLGFIQKALRNDPENSYLQSKMSTMQWDIERSQKNIQNYIGYIGYDPLYGETEEPTTSSPTETPTTSSPTTSTPTVTDKTNENIESPINGAGYYDQWIAYQKEQQEANWKREDEIRKEVQEREDNAWQRAVEDMRKAGVNPNLVDAGPASSGGGIYNATQVDNSTLNTAMTSEVSKYAADLEAETANLDREMQMKIAQVQASLEKYLAEYNGDIQLTLQAFEHDQEKLIAEIEHNYSKELAEIEQKYSKEIQYLEQKFTSKENTKNRIVTIISSLAGVFSISTLFKKK